MSTINMLGKTFGRLRVIRQGAPAKSNGAMTWECECSCGGSSVVRGDLLRTGETKSCGCFQRECRGSVQRAKTNCERCGRRYEHYLHSKQRRCVKCHRARENERTRWARLHDPARKKQERVRNILRKAIAAGELKRPSKCECCRKHQPIIDAHHHDYSKPKDVMWVCRQCHRDIHMALAALARNSLRQGT